MLISQRILKFSNFLKHHPKHPYTASAIRNGIVNAYKFIVDEEMLPAKMEQVSKGTIDISMTVDTPVVDSMVRNYKKHQEFSKMPFQKMFIETQNIGLLVSEESDPKFGMMRNLCLISKDGHTFPVVLQVALEPEKTVSAERLATAKENSSSWSTLLYDMDTIDTDAAAYFHELMSTVNNLLNEILLFLNVTNTRIHEYKSSKKDVGPAVAALLPFYEYRVLDIFRESGPIKILKDVEGFLTRKRSVSVVDRRAHIVRGHFKNIKGKLCWWSSFMRNAKNLETVGFVDKDYNMSNEKVTALVA